MKNMKYLLFLFLGLFLFNRNVFALKKYDFSYTGDVQEFKVPYSGEYLLEVWGAKGGDYNATYLGGKGGYSKGVISLKKGEIIYIYVGGKGTTAVGYHEGGYNGGARSTHRTEYPSGSGGGATDIRIVGGTWNNSDSLFSRFIVAGGGGSASPSGDNKNHGNGGYGGGLTGGAGTANYSSSIPGGGGTQTAGGTRKVCGSNQPGIFGKGGDPDVNTNGCFAGAGGGGWYGGGAGDSSGSGGGGGSGFALTADSVLNTPEGYTVTNDYYLKDTEVIAGNAEMPSFNSDETMIGNNDDGYARVTLLSRSFVIDIDVQNAKLDQEFDKEIFDYELYLKDNSTEVTFDVKNPNENYAYTGTGSYNLAVGDTHYVTAITMDGSMIIYSFKVKGVKASVDNITFDEFNFSFDKNINEYDITVSNNITTATPHITKNANTTYEINKLNYLYVGVNKLTILVKENGKIDETYTFNITREDREENATSFDYKDSPQTYTVPKSGYYKLEVWGASGGDYNTKYLGGKGGYSKGIVYLTEGQLLYVYTGGVGTAGTGVRTGGYNGGGNSSGRNVVIGGKRLVTATGGGATDIRLVGGTWNNSDSLLSRIIVAGGGGSGASNNTYFGSGGAGGGISGLNGTSTGNSYGYKPGGGGSQNAGGTSVACTDTSGAALNKPGTFGQGGHASTYAGSCMAGAGGGGWYGGGAGQTGGAAGGGGSGFVLTNTSVANVPANYSPDSSFYMINDLTLDGSESIPTHDGNETMIGNLGNGYAKITFVSENNPNGEIINIITSAGTLTPNFDKNIKSYTLNLDSEDDFITISAESDNFDSKILGTGEYEIKAGETNINISLISPSGEVSVYQILVKREASGDDTLQSIKVNGGSVKDFDPEVLEYTVNVPYNVKYIELEPVKGKIGQTLTFEENIELTNDETDVTTFVVSEDKLANKLYTIHIKREQTTFLKELRIFSSIVNIDFSPTKTEYDLEIPAGMYSLNMEAIPYSDKAVAKIFGNGYIEDGPITILVTNEGIPDTTYTLNIIRKKVDKTIYEYPYTGSYQEFIVPVSGRYLLETWGAEGGSFNATYKGGKGAYAKGVLILEQGQVLYIFVGGRGTAGIGLTEGGYNGGGDSSGRTVQLTPSGGGATDIRIKINNTGDWNDPNSLLSRFLVAAGGGSGAWNGSSGGSGGVGGALTGGNGTSNYNSSLAGKGATQTAGGAANICRSGAVSSYNQPGSFGQGGNASKVTIDCLGGGGGSGWYGGGSGHSSGAGAGGGSSFAYTKANQNDTPSGYLVTDKFQMIDTELIAGNKALPTHDGKSKVVGNSGDGFAKITLLSEVSSNNFLDSISINDELVENFDTTKLEYNITLNEDAVLANIDAISKDENALITGVGNFDIAPGDSIHEIIVTASDGSIRTYTLNIFRSPSSDSTPLDIKLEKVITSLCNLHDSYCQYNFDKEEINYEIVLPFNNDVAELVPILKSKYQEVVYRIIKESGQEEQTSGLVDLSEGQVILEIEIISEDKVNTTTYRYTLEKDLDGNNNLASLTIVDPVITIEDFDPYVYEYYIELPGDISSYEISAIPEDINALVKISGNTNLKVGMNDCIVMVTSKSGIKKSYIIHAYKGQDTNVYLSDLIVKDNASDTVIPLVPTFNKLLNEYTIEVENSIDTINILGTSESGGAIVAGLGVKSLKTGTNTFEISVQNDGSEVVNIYKLNVLRKKNSNANLQNIEVENFSLSPSFDKDITEYNVKFEGDISKLNLNITPEVATTTYTIRGNTLINNYNEITITAVAEDKSYKVYKIIATKDLSDDNYLTNILVKGTDEVYQPSFDKEESNYTMDVLEDVSKIEIEGIKSSKKAVVTGNGIYSLQKGLNTITLTVTSESGNIRTYNLEVNRAKNDDLTLKSITNDIGSEVTKMEDNSKGYDYLINVQYEINQISLMALPNASTSKVSGEGTFTLQVGNNDITLRVISESGNQKDYVVRIVRDLSTNDDLSFLFVKEGGLNPIFNETTIHYDVLVPYEAREVHITAIPEDVNASYEIIGDVTNLEVGIVREIQVVVTAQKGNKKTYNLSILRQEETVENLALESLETNRGDLIPTFSPDTLNYEITVPHDVEDITILGTAFSDDVKILGLDTYNLKVGKNAISIFVVSNDNGIQRDYQIVVTRKKSNDATLSSLVVKGNILKPNFDKNVLNYTLTTSSSVLDFTVIKPTEKDATYEVLDNKDFVTGENIVTIRVTAPDGETTKDYVLTVTKEGSKNNNLAALEVEGYQLMPVFHKGVTFYAVDIPSDVNSIVINATSEDEFSTINGTGLKNVNPGENYFEIVVTSEIGTTKTYTILITREASNNNYLTNIVIPGYDLLPSFDKEINEYEVSVPFTENIIDVYATPEDVNANVTGADTYNLVEGENLITLIVTSESGLVRTYNVKVTKESPVSVYLKSLEINGYELDTEFNKENLEYYVTVDNEVTHLDLIYELEDANAVAEVTGNENFEVGMNEVHITVRREVKENDILEQDYVIYVNRQMSSNNYLDYITVSDGEFTEDFESNKMDYTVMVNHDVTEVIIDAKAQDKNSKIIAGLGKKVLELGDNIVEIKVRSSIGIIRTYTLHIIREASDNNYLTSLKVVDGTNEFQLTPVFDKLINNYEVVVNSDLEFVDIVGEKESELATVNGLETVLLETGDNNFDISVTSESGIVNIYKIKIIKEASNNNYATMIKPSSGELVPEFSKEVTNYTLEVEDVSSLYFEVTVENNKATVSGHKIQPLDEGVSTRVITITAEDGTTREYTITIERPSKSNALLESLEIEGYPIEFDPNTFVYNISVSKSKKELLESEIKAIPKDSEATVNLMGDITLGEDIINVYTIEVIAKDGYTTEEYTLNITRDSEEYTIRSEVYDIRREEVEFPYVIGIEPDTNMSVFKDNFLNDSSLLHVYSKDGKEIEEESKLVGTAMTLKLEKDGYVYDEVKVIVRGDLNYDGKVNGADQLTMDNFIVKIVKFDGYQQLAADITKDGKVNGADQLSMDNYIVKILKKLN